jgi:type IV secretion system protein VirB3
VTQLRSDPLFVGLTRPATLLGVPYAAFVLEVVVVMVIFINLRNPLYAGLALPVHGVLYLISAHDPGIFAAIFQWGPTIGRCRNIDFWGAASFSPLPLKKWRAERRPPR